MTEVSDYQRRVVTRLRTARGHLDGVIRMVEAGAYCPDLMKQLSAVQGLLEGTSRAVLRNHLETCVAHAMREGRIEEIVDELMEALKYDKRVLRPALADDDLETAMGGAGDHSRGLGLPKTATASPKTATEAGGTGT